MRVHKYITIFLLFCQNALFFEIIGDSIEHPVDKLAALGRAVRLGQFDILVEGNPRRYRGEFVELAHGHHHDDYIHEGNPLDLPIADEVLDVVAILVAMQQGGKCWRSTYGKRIGYIL